VKFIHPAHKNKPVSWYLILIWFLVSLIYWALGYINSRLCVYLGEQNIKCSMVYYALSTGPCTKLIKLRLQGRYFFIPLSHSISILVCLRAMAVGWPLFIYFFKLQSYQKPPCRIYYIYIFHSHNSQHCKRKTNAVVILPLPTRDV